MFYCLDNPLKPVWVGGNIVATVVYCLCLFYWMWIKDNNDLNPMESFEDARVIHLSLGTVIFYSLFLLERIGMLILDCLHC